VARGGIIVTQVNINDPDGPRNVDSAPVTHTTSDSGTGHAIASGINLITTLVVLAVALVIVYFIFQMIVPLIR
jgi:hypothetical protein